MKLKNFTLALSLCVLSTSAVFAEMTDAEREVYADTGHVTTQLKMENDNPFLNLMPDLFYVDDDHGYTHGLELNVDISPSADKAIFKGYSKKMRLGSSLFLRKFIQKM